MEYVWFDPTNGPPLSAGYGCPGNPAAKPPGPTRAGITRAFQQIHLPPSTLVIQPPGGVTLVNFDTNFYTHAAPFERTLTLLDHHIRFRITPQRFDWHFGDDGGRTTSTPGAAYPDLQVTHRYRATGTAAPSVDVTWHADYQLDNQPWTPVEDTVTIHGTAQRLTITSATPILTG